MGKREDNVERAFSLVGLAWSGVERLRAWRAARAEAKRRAAFEAAQAELTRATDSALKHVPEAIERAEDLTARSSGRGRCRYVFNADGIERGHRCTRPVGHLGAHQPDP